MDIEKILVSFIITPLLISAIIGGFYGAGLFIEGILLQLGLRWIPLGLVILGLYSWIKNRD